MKNKFIFLSVFFILLNVNAEIDSYYLIEGKIGTAFNKTEVLVVDEFNQKYYLPKKLFPSKFEFKKDTPFQVEIAKELFDQIKIIKE